MPSVTFTTYYSSDGDLVVILGTSWIYLSRTCGHFCWYLHSGGPCCACRSKTGLSICRYCLGRTS